MPSQRVHQKLNPKRWAEEVEELPFSGTAEGAEIRDDYLRTMQQIQEEYFKAQMFQLRRIALIVLIIAFPLSLIFTLLVIAAQGFGIFGFQLPEEVIVALGVATIGEVAGLILALFKL